MPGSPPAPTARLSSAWIAAILTLLVRALIACSRLDELELELYGGSFARALLVGMPLDHARLPIIVHLRGSALFGLLTAPLFWLLGSTLVAIKVLAVGWSVATAACFAWVLERRGGRAAGLSAALLLALAPPFFQIVDVLALGSHGDTLLPIWAALGWLIARRAGTPRRPGELAIAGFLLAFGVWFSMQFLVALPALLAAWYLAWRQAGGSPRELLARPLATLRSLGFLLLGMLPPLAAIPYVTRSLTWVNRPAEDQLLPAGLGGLGAKLLQFLQHDLRRALLLDEYGGAWASWLLLAAALVGLVLLLPRLWKRLPEGPRAPSPLAVFVLLHPVLFLFAYVSTDFVVDFSNTLDGMGSRYLMPATPAVLAWIALGVCRLVGQRRRLLAYGLLGAGAVPGLVGVWALADPLPGWRQPAVFGARPFYFLAQLDYASRGDPLQYAHWSERLDPHWAALKPLLYRTPLPKPFESQGDPFALVSAIVALREQPEAVRAYQLAEIGRQFVDRNEYEAELLVESLQALELMYSRGSVTSAERDRLVHAAFQQIVMIAGGRAIMNRGVSPYGYALLARAPEGQQRIAADGLGFMSGVRYSPYDRAFVENLGLATLVPEALREQFYFSVGLGYRQRFLEPGYVAPEPGILRIEQHLPPEGLAAFARGLRAPAAAWRSDP